MEDPIGKLDTDKPKRSKKDVYVTLATVCVTWLFSFTAYSGLQNLESSLNPTVGVYSLAALTGGGVISCILAPAVLGTIGNKGGLITSWICLCLFIAANYYPKSYVLIPAAAIEGLSTGLMWTANGCILVSIASDYAAMVGETLDVILSRFFGIFCMAFESTQIWGNLISSVVFQSSDDSDGNSTRSDIGNMTTTSSGDSLSQCGFFSCPGPETPIKALPTGPLVYTLISVYLGMTVIGLIITLIFLKPDKSPPTTTLKGMLFSTLNLLCTNLNMALLVPFSFYTGLEQVFLYAEYTRVILVIFHIKKYTCFYDKKNCYNLK